MAQSRLLENPQKGTVSGLWAVASAHLSELFLGLLHIVRISVRMPFPAAAQSRVRAQPKFATAREGQLERSRHAQVQLSNVHRLFSIRFLDCWLVRIMCHPQKIIVFALANGRDAGQIQNDKQDTDCKLDQPKSAHLHRSRDVRNVTTSVGFSGSTAGSSGHLATLRLLQVTSSKAVCCCVIGL